MWLKLWFSRKANLSIITPTYRLDVRIILEKAWFHTADELSFICMEAELSLKDRMREFCHLKGNSNQSCYSSVSKWVRWFVYLISTPPGGCWACPTENIPKVRLRTHWSNYLLNAYVTATHWRLSQFMGSFYSGRWMRPTEFKNEGYIWQTSFQAEDIPRFFVLPLK